MLLRNSRSQCRRVTPMAYLHPTGEGARVYLYITCCHLDFRPAGRGEGHESLALWIPGGAWGVDGQLTDACRLVLASLLPCFTSPLLLSCPLGSQSQMKAFFSGSAFAGGTQTKRRIVYFIVNSWTIIGTCPYSAADVHISAKWVNELREVNKNLLKGRAWKYG